MINETHGELAVERRRFLNLCAGAIAVAFAAKNSPAAELPHLAPSDPAASALGYVEDSIKVNDTKYPQHAPAQSCTTCKQFTSQGGGYGSCLIFPGKAVNARGWCSVYVPQI